jgi:hypothetical protein
MLFQSKTNARPAIEVPHLTPLQMYRLAQEAIRAIEDRTAEGRNANDDIAPPLSKGWARHKEKRGEEPIRNLRDTGDLMRALEVTEYGSSHAIVTVGNARDFQKGIINDYRDPWFGLSDHDEFRVTQLAQQMFSENVRRANDDSFPLAA